ncbi:pncA, partial [Symbiodinium necroappetens]
VHGAAVEAAAWRSSNLSCWSCHAAGAQMTAAMQQGKCGALKAAMAKEQDVLDFLVDLLSLRQPAVTQAVAAAIVCGPLLFQLHVLAERHRYMNRPQSIWEILMMDVENNGRPPLSWRCFCDVHTCRKRVAMIWRVPKARAKAGGRRCHAGPGFTI